jgi:hypothetical protein
MRMKDHLDFVDLSSVISRFQLWRLFTNHLFFTNPGELLFGLLLLYHFRLFERQMGVVKFGSFAFVSVVASTLAQVALYVVSPSSTLSSGPYSFIFSCLVLFFTSIPSTYRFQLCGVSATDKLFTYILAVQLLLSNPPNSIFSGLCGILGGLAYKSDLLGLSRWKLPRPFTAFCSRFVRPLLESPPRPTSHRPTVPIVPNARPPVFPSPFLQQVIDLGSSFDPLNSPPTLKVTRTRCSQVLWQPSLPLSHLATSPSRC